MLPKRSDCASVILSNAKNLVIDGARPFAESTLSVVEALRATAKRFGQHALYIKPVTCQLKCRENRRNIRQMQYRQKGMGAHGIGRAVIPSGPSTMLRAAPSMSRGGAPLRRSSGPRLKNLIMRCRATPKGRMRSYRRDDDGQRAEGPSGRLTQIQRPDHFSLRRIPTVSLHKWRKSAQNLTRCKGLRLPPSRMV